MQFERWATVNLDEGQAAVMDLGPTLYRGDTNPLKVGIRLLNSQGPVMIAGEAAARARDAQGQVYSPLATGEDENEAWCIIPQTVLAWPGKVDIWLRVADSTDTAVTLHAFGTVQDTGDGTILNPGQPIPSVEALQAAADLANQAAAAAEAAAKSSVRYDEAQQLDDTEQETARENIGAASAGEVADLKGASETAHGGEVIKLAWDSTKNGYYINTSGTTVDLENPTAHQNMTYNVYEAAPDEIFTVKGKIYASNAAWLTFINDSGTILDKYTGTQSKLTIVKAPAGTTKLIMQRRKGSGSALEYNVTIYRGGITYVILDYLQAQINALSPASLSMSPLMSTAPTTEPDETDGEGENTDER